MEVLWAFLGTFVSGAGLCWPWLVYAGFAWVLKGSVKLLGILLDAPGPFQRCFWTLLGFVGPSWHFLALRCLSWSFPAFSRLCWPLLGFNACYYCWGRAKRASKASERSSLMLSLGFPCLPMLLLAHPCFLLLSVASLLCMLSGIFF